MKKLTFILSITLTLSAFAQVPSYVPTNGLVGWWPFNGNANDESGNGNNGTVNGATLTSDRFLNSNNAYSFDGVDDFIQIPNINLINGQNGISVSAWCQIIGYNGQICPDCYQYIVSKGSDANTGHFGIKYSQNPNSFDFFISVNNFQTNGYIYSNSSYPIPQSSWHNLIMTYDNQNLKVYVDGILRNSMPYTLPYSPNLDPILVGKHILSSFPYFTNGKIDDIGIWNRALTPQEVTALYNGCQQSILTQPQSQSVNFNDNVQFTAASSDPNANYQWQTNLGLGFQNLTDAGQYSGSSTNTLNVSNVALSNNNQQFRCIVNSGSCTDTSDVALLTVVNNVGLVEQNQMQLFVYPNPTSSIITIENPQGLNSNFLVVDAQGREIHSGTLNTTTTLNLHAFPTGIYTILFENKALQEMKVVKE